MSGTPVTYASDLTYVGLSSEAIQGTPTTPTATILLTKDPASKDNQVYLEDQGMRQSMAEVYGAVLGPLAGDLQLDGDLRADTGCYMLGNVMGDYTMTGTTTTPTTTLSSQANAGATSLSTAASIPNGTTIQVGTGLTAEVFVTGTPTGAGPFTIPLAPTSGAQNNGTLAFTHASAQTVTAITTPYTYQFALQNGGTTGAQALLAQAHSLTVTDWYGPTASSGARQYPGTMLSDLTITMDPTKLLTFSAKASTWGSQPSGSTPPVITSGLQPLAGWTLATGLGGPASGGTLVNNIENLSMSLTRQVKVYQTLGGQNPYIIRQGKLGVSGKFTAIVNNETLLTNYLTGVQPQLQFLITNGAGATKQQFQFDMAKVFYKVVAINRGDIAVKMDVDFTAVANTTNVGASGGFSPLMVTVQNALAVGSI